MISITCILRKLSVYCTVIVSRSSGLLGRTGKSFAYWKNHINGKAFGGIIDPLTRFDQHELV